MRTNKFKAAKIHVMKKAIVAVILISLFVLASACNKHTCPAYANNGEDQIETNG
jgi:hypothetical protein